MIVARALTSFCQASIDASLNGSIAAVDPCIPHVSRSPCAYFSWWLKMCWSSYFVSQWWIVWERNFRTIQHPCPEGKYFQLRSTSSILLTIIYHCSTWTDNPVLGSIHGKILISKRFQRYIYIFPRIHIHLGRCIIFLYQILRPSLWQAPFRFMICPQPDTLSLHVSTATQSWSGALHFLLNTILSRILCSENL